MRVFIAGATGVLGRRLVAECADRGHEVVGLTRDDTGAALIAERDGDPVRGDLLDRESLVTGIEEIDVVVHAATKIPTDTNPADEDWAVNDRIRREGTENLVAAATAAGVDRFIQQSIVWVARQPDGRPFDETAEPNPDRSTRSALDAERIVRTAANEHEFEPVILRGGYFYAADTAHSRLIGERLVAGRLPIIGRGLLGRRDVRLSFIHVDDMARAVAAAIESNSVGTFHVVDDEPASYARFLQTFADNLGLRHPRRIPAWLARYFLDPNLVRLLSCPMPTTNSRARETFGWTPTFSTIQEGIDHVVAKWHESGLVTERNGGLEWTGT